METDNKELASEIISDLAMQHHDDLDRVVLVDILGKMAHIINTTEEMYGLPYEETPEYISIEKERLFLDLEIISDYIVEAKTICSKSGV